MSLTPSLPRSIKIGVWSLLLWMLLGLIFIVTVIGAVVLNVPLLILIGIIGMVVLVVCIKYNLWLTFYVALFMVQILPLAKFLGATVHPSHVFLIGMICQQGVSALICHRWRLRSPHWLDLAVLLYVLLAISSLLWTPVPSSTAVILIIRMLFVNVLAYLVLAREVALNWHGTMIRVVFGFALFVWYLIGTTSYNLWQVGIWSLLAELQTSALSGSNGLGVLDSTVMMSVTTAGRNVLSGWLVLGLFLLWGVYKEAEAIGLSQIMRRTLLFTAFLALAFVIIALSRSSWFSLIVGFFAWLFCSGFRFSLRRIAWVVTFLVGIMAGLHLLGFDQVIIARLMALGNVKDLGLTRTDVWTAIWKSFLQHPLGGTGIAGLEEVISSVIEGLGNPHNIYFYFLGEYGLLGIAVIAFIIASSVFGVWQATQHSIKNKGRFWYGVFAALIALLVQGVFQYAFSEVVIWVILGLSGGAIAVNQRSHHTTGTKAVILSTSHAE